MIKLERPEKPKILYTKGKIETEKLKSDFENGIIKFEFKEDIYKHKTVKEPLRNLQNDKCCFCESKEEIGDIEHFRPKSHYCWLAYDWENLLFSCPTCNRSFKRTNFPIENEKYRAKKHSDNINLEQTLLINPYHENPEKYLSFNKTTIFAINGNLKGKMTIEKLGLNRPYVNKRKNDIYKACKEIFEIINETKEEDTKKRLINLLESYTLPSVEYSLMIKCALKDNFKY